MSERVESKSEFIAHFHGRINFALYIRVAGDESFLIHDLHQGIQFHMECTALELLMDGGRIVQCGTAREIIANPVSDYVAEFVAHMNPLGVLTARDVMQSGSSSATQAVDVDTPVKQVMAMLINGVTELAVTEQGRAIGLIRSEVVMAKLINPRSAA